MRGDTGKSVPVLRDFIVEILTPHTPEKPIIPNPQALSNQEQRQGSIIQYDAGFTHGANQAMGWTPLYKPPTRLSESASSSNSSIHHDRLFASTNNTMNGIDPMAHWRGMTLAPHTPEKPIVPNPQALSNQEQRQGSIIHYDAGLSHGANQAMRWTPLYRPPTRLSESASSGNSSIHQDRLFASTNNMMNGTNPMAHGRGMTFSDLLALNHGFPSPTAFLSGNQESMRLLGGLDQRTEIQQNAANALPDAANALPDAVNAFPRASAPVFAPATPGNAAPGKTFFSADRQPNRQRNKQNKVAAIDDLLGINGTQSATDPIPIERCDPDYKPDLDLNKTSHISQPKPRRKKHRPKVVSEAKPKKTPTERTPKPTDANETPRPKRTSVRKSKATTPPDSEAEALDFKIPARVVKSCRKALYFDLEDAAVFMEETGEYSAYDVFVNNQTPPKDEFSAETEYESGRKMKNLTAISLQKENSTEAMEPRDFIESSAYYNTRSNSNRGKHKSGLKRANSDYMFLGNGIFSCTHYMYFPKIHKKRRTEKVLKPNISHMLSFTNALENIRFGAAKGSYPKGGHGIYFPEFRKKRRTEKVRKLNTSCALSFMHALENSRAGKRQNYRRETAKHSKYYSILVPHVNIGAEGNVQASTVPSHQDYTQITKWGDMDKLHKRFIAPMCIDDLDSQKGFKECKKKLKYPAKGRDEGTWKKNVKTFNLSCMEAHPKVNNNKKDRRKSGKKNSAAKVVTSSFNMVYKHSLNSYRDQHFTRSSKGPFVALPWINTNTTDIDDIIEGMQQLSINRECSIVQYQEENTLTPYHDQNQQANALVLYQRDDVMIPFERTQASKRRERAKVDLDDETNRVWNLLLEDINNQGIDGTDEEKTKWWEDERKVFRGRVDSFIARMRLVQGDRRFSPWKGSVVDSVVGVFLTQNVSDHLSSSAFMSLAARYPSKSENKATRDSEEEIGPSVKEQEICIVELDDNSENLTLSEKTVEGHIWDLNCRTIHNSDVSEEKVVNSEESQFCGASSIKESETSSATVDDRAIDDLSSSQHSVISQKSVESPSVPTSGEEPANGSASFVELLKLAETLDATYTPIEQVSSCQSDLLDQEEILRYDNPSEKALRSENDSFSNVPIKCPAIYQLQPVKEYHVHSVNEESSSVNTTSSVENLTTDPCAAITESATEFHLQKKALKSNLVLSSSAVNACSFYVLEGEEMVFQSLKQPVREQQDTINSLTEGSVSPQTNIMLPTVSTENSTVDDNLTPILPISDQNKSSNGEAHEVFKKDASKKKTLNKRKKVSYDWDSLRKQAQTNGSNSKQRTANKMDSIDWEAIRCADVNEIAETIRDRGMNNMLAERIKEFLDRVVNDHGSIDLEWLRDVSPDKAKEYLLSIRGLGLKSVECVRLLTLHHLAFPVDTNVGRIAVRLGWVPLQPLPESLQLHLLELYPVLESIQKYLWPRLCKLDQRTLYELHYHMITFGKVFCTKRQPNCNACPLRGECRHFASAFASARLALPGPQDKSIILSDQSNLTHQDPQVTVNPLPMPLLMADQSLEKRSDVRNCEPIVEIPASPEQEPEQIQTLECDIEEAFSEDPNEIPTIRLNMEEFTHTLQAYMQSNKELEGDMSNALVALASEAASIPTPKLKNVNRLRTEHHVYELPDTHYLLRGLDRREPDDPCPYLLAIWSPGETANSRELPEKRCNFQEPGQLCSDETCFYCNSQREANSQTIRGTLLIPCRTAMRGSFPLNGTYFQVNEVFADQDSSLNPIQVPRALLWNLPRRTVYFGTSIPTIFKGLSTEGIQHCFWRGYVCVRGFDQKTRAPRPLMARLHFPASKSRARGRRSE